MSTDYVCSQCGPDPRGPDVHAEMEHTIPVRLCCLKPHWTVECPDGKVMCCLCFDRFEVAELAIVDGSPIDICKPCYEYDQEMLRRKQFRDKLHSLTLIPPRHDA